MIEVILTIMVIYVTMVYGPIAAFLVEMFPTKIRYTSMSLPYHIGNGWFGGILPLAATAIVAAYGDIYAGLWYPIIVAVMTFVIGSLLLQETKDIDINEGSGVDLHHQDLNTKTEAVEEIRGRRCRPLIVFLLASDAAGAPAMFTRKLRNQTSKIAR